MIYTQKMQIIATNIQMRFNFIWTAPRDRKTKSRVSCLFSKDKKKIYSYLFTQDAVGGASPVGGATQSRTTINTN